MGKTVRLLASMGAAVLIAMVVVLVTAIGAMKPATAAGRPNIVFVLTDDQFPGTENAMPALKNNVTSQGVKFTNMTSTFPLCCPGRATILRGQYAHNTRINGNTPPAGGWQKFRNQGLQKSTIATWLHKSGYQTGLFGKYMNNYAGRDIPPGWDRWYAWNGPYEGWTSLNDQGTRRPLRPRDADSGVSNAAIKFLDDRLDSPKPVFAFVSFGAAHKPHLFDQADADKFRGARVPRTPSFNEGDVSDKPPYVRKLAPLTGAEVSRLDRSYANSLRSLMRVDRFIRRASDLLRRRGEMRNTYFVFYTDNGSHFGQHRFEHGKLQPYNEDVNFPLIVRGPGVPHGVKSAKLLGNHDIAPTLASMGGASVPAFVDGRSVLALAKRPATATWSRTAVLSGGKTDDAAHNVWAMLRMSGKSYTSYQNGKQEFYDLTKDPHQLHNAFGASDTAYPPPDSGTQAYYKGRLNDLYACSGRKGPGSCREAENAPSLPKGKTP